MNFVIGLVLLYAIAVVWGLPNLHPPTTAIVGETACVSPEVTKGKLGDCNGPGPAALAGIKPGDTVVKVGGTDVATFEEMVAAVRKLDAPTPFVVQRTENGQAREFTTTVDVTKTQRLTQGRQRRTRRRRRRRHRRRSVRPDPVQPAVGRAGHGRLHRRPHGRARQVAGEDPDQGRRAVALHRRWRTRPGDADQRRRRQHHRRRHRRRRAVGGVLVLPRPAELRARRGEPGAAAAVRRRPHRDCRVREDPQYDSVGARQGRRGAR